VGYIGIVRQWHTNCDTIDRLRVQFERFDPGKTGGGGAAVNMFRFESFDRDLMRSRLWNLTKKKSRHYVQVLFMEARDCGIEAFSVHAVEKEMVVSQLFNRSVARDVWRPVFARSKINNVKNPPKLPVVCRSFSTIRQLTNTQVSLIVQSTNVRHVAPPALMNPGLIASWYRYTKTTVYTLEVRCIQDDSIVRSIREIAVEVNTRCHLTAMS